LLLLFFVKDCLDEKAETKIKSVAKTFKHFKWENNQIKKKYAAWIDKISGLLPIPEDKLKNDKQWRLVTMNSTHRADGLLIEMDMPHIRVEHNVSESYFIALYLRTSFWRVKTLDM
jgi:FtsZ-binding cell division protein ZapB